MGRELPNGRISPVGPSLLLAATARGRLRYAADARSPRHPAGSRGRQLQRRSGRLSRLLQCPQRVPGIGLVEELIAVAGEQTAKIVESLEAARIDWDAHVLSIDFRRRLGQSLVLRSHHRTSLRERHGRARRSPCGRAATATGWHVASTRYWRALRCYAAMASDGRELLSKPGLFSMAYRTRLNYFGLQSWDRSG
jgi:hypothetical protein